MSDRLKELHRQRALAQEQLDWFDRELAAERGSGGPAPTPPAPAVSPITLPRPTAPTPPPPGAKPVVDADAILAQYQGDPEGIQKHVKLGCALYGLAALTLLVLGLTAFYFLHLHR